MDDKELFWQGFQKGASQGMLTGGILMIGVAIYSGVAVIAVLGSVAIIAGALGLVVWESWYGK